MRRTARIAVVAAVAAAVAVVHTDGVRGQKTITITSGKKTKSPLLPSLEDSKKTNYSNPCKQPHAPDYCKH